MNPKFVFSKRNIQLTIISTFIYILCFANYYFDVNVPGWEYFQFYGRWGCIAICFLLYIMQIYNTTNPQNKAIRKPTKSMIIALLLFVITVLSTAMNGGYVRDCIHSFSGILLSLLFLEYHKKNANRIYRIFQTWIAISLCLAFIDIASELVFKNGLYTTNIKYYTYWFLGYKTERLRVILPMIEFSIFNSFRTNKYKGTLLICAISCISTILSGATSASLVLLMITAIYISVIVFGRNPKKGYPKIFNVIFDYRLLLLIYLVVVIVIVFMENSSMAMFVSMYFNKGTAFSGRGQIWKHCLTMIKSSPIIGVGYHTTRQYQDITRMLGGTNAHNMFLTLLMDSGAIGLVLYLYIIFSTFRTKEKGTKKDYKRLSIVMMNYLIFVLGVTSSIMVFASFGFVGFWILEYYDRSNWGLVSGY